jgi:hypothetical protein
MVSPLGCDSRARIHHYLIGSRGMFVTLGKNAGFGQLGAVEGKTL